jgi:hypothetical protein
MDELEPITLVALTPAEMPAQQQALIEWCGRKIAQVERELAVFVGLQEEAVKGGFRHATYTASANRTSRRIEYYKKIKAAVEAGYLIVPNMPTVTFAVRVNRANPQRHEGSYQHGRRVSPQLLPEGEGRYVDETPFVGSYKYSEEENGKQVAKVRYFNREFDDDIDFPLAGVVPVVLQKTAQAMARKLFDQMGVVQNSGGRDPIVVGQILDPRGNNRLATFFVAWWLNPDTL